MNEIYSWHGEPVKTEFGQVIVRENADRPLFWYNYEANMDVDGLAIIEAVKVTTSDGHTFLISNHFGIGNNKLKKGGWPDQQHFSFNENDIVSFTNESEFSSLGKLGHTNKFDEVAFSEHEAKRLKWQSVTHPEAFAEMQKMRDHFKSLYK